MITRTLKHCWPALLLCLWSASPVLAQQRFGGGGGGGGGFGGGAFRGNNGGFSSFSGGSGSSGASSTRDYPNSTMPGPVTVTVNPDTRQVFVVTDDNTYSNVAQVIANLDRPKPQVLIKVVFLEVTHSDDLDFGIEGNYTHNPSPSALGQMGQVGLTNLFGLAQQGAAGSLIGGNQMPTGAGLYSVTGNDFQATLRAIASAGKAQVLSRPSVMVRNNQPATITVGQSIPLVTSVTYNALNGQPISTIQYQNVGVILQVTPFITQDGLVEMIVAPQISSLASEQVQIAAGVNAPAINLRSASTVVVTPDGQTVVIGGLMESDKTVVDSKIPILGDIPGLGMLFKRHQRDNTKTELMIFLTPHVVNMPAEVASATASEAGKTGLSRKDFSEQEINQYLDTIPLKQPAGSGKH